MNWGGIIFGVVILFIIGLVVWWEIASWRECMIDHSWWYCLRILGGNR